MSNKKTEQKPKKKKKTRGCQVKTGVIDEYWTKRGRISTNTTVSMISNSA